MQQDDFLYHLNLDYNKKMLHKEFLQYSKTLIPVYQPLGQSLNLKDLSTEDNWFLDQEDWLINDINDDRNIDNLSDYYDTNSETYRIYKLLEKILHIEMALPRFGVLAKGKNIPMHTDLACLAGINIIISDTAAPIHFADYGSIDYKCALINTSKLHSVPAFDHDRILIRFPIPSTIDYNYCKQNLQHANF